MPTLILDIETAGKEFDSFDDVTKKELLKRLTELDPACDEYAQKTEEVKNSLGLSPLTGEIITIGMYDYDLEQAIVLYQAPGETNETITEANVTYVQKTEIEMLLLFWEKIKAYDEFVTFYGRGFDAPWLMIRSAIHKITPSKDLMSGRYLYQQKGPARHIDLADQFTFYGSANLPSRSLHMYCQAFGIETPKNSPVSGAGVSDAYRTGKYLEIARYNAMDIIATKQLYDYWHRYLRF